MRTETEAGADGVIGVDDDRRDGTRANGRPAAAPRGARAADGAPGADGSREASPDARPGFLRRYRLPLVLGLVALCLYAGSILYILYGRGQIA